MLPLPEQHINKVNAVDIPAVWALVLVDNFFALPWPGIAAFLASLYTFLRIVGMALKWWHSR